MDKVSSLAVSAMRGGYEMPKKKKKYKKQVSRHHIIPRSKGGTNQTSNIKKTTTSRHRAWHHLFGNATPLEAIEIIKAEWS